MFVWVCKGIGIDNRKTVTLGNPITMIYVKFYQALKISGSIFGST